MDHGETMKKLIATAALGKSFKKVHEIIKPTQMAYAKKIGAEFAEFIVPPAYIEQVGPHWVKFHVGGMMMNWMLSNILF